MPAQDPGVLAPQHGAADPGHGPSRSRSQSATSGRERYGTFAHTWLPCSSTTSSPCGAAQRLALGRLPRDQAVEPAGDEQRGPVEPLEHAVEVERQRPLARIVAVARARLVRERLTRELRQRVPQLAEVERAADPGDGADPRLERRRARCVVAAEADAERADALEVEVLAAVEPVEHRRDRDLVVGPDRQLVSALALPRAVERERRHAAAQEHLLEREELLLGRVQPGDQEHERRALDERRPAQVAEHGGVVERRLDPLRRRVERGGAPRTAPRPPGRRPRGCGRRRAPRRTCRSGTRRRRAATRRPR